MKIISVEFNKDLTTKWWDHLLGDETAMERWLCKLWRTEAEGLQDNLDAADKYAQNSQIADNIFRATGRDEEVHGNILLELLDARGIVPVAAEQPPSIYWAHVNSIVTDLPSCAAAFAVGEQLAADRFEYIYEHNRTPSDVKFFLETALQDEAYHARSFAKISTEDAIKIAIARHYEAVNMMMKVQP